MWFFCFSTHVAMSLTLVPSETYSEHLFVSFRAAPSQPVSILNLRFPGPQIWAQPLPFRLRTVAARSLDVIGPFTELCRVTAEISIVLSFAACNRHKELLQLGTRTDPCRAA